MEFVFDTLWIILICALVNVFFEKVVWQYSSLHRGERGSASLVPAERDKPRHRS